MTEIVSNSVEWPRRAIALPLSVNLHNLEIATGVCGEMVANLRQAVFKDADWIVVDSFEFTDPEPKREDYGTRFTKQAMITAWQEFGHKVATPNAIKLPTKELSPAQLGERIQAVSNEIVSHVGYLAVVGGTRLKRFGVALQDEAPGETGQVEPRIQHHVIRDGGILVPDGEGGWRKHSSGGQTLNYLRD